MGEMNPNKRRGRKRKKNFLMNARKYAKKGQMGRGTQISEELYQYFVGILESMKRGIESEEERRALVDNVLERTRGIELDVIGNQLGCRVIELLLPTSSPAHLERYMDTVSQDLRRLCSDNFSSHVIECVLRVASDRATDAECDQGHARTCDEFTLKLSRYALNNLEDFVWDRYADHILRSVLRCLSGITLLPGEKPKVNMFKEAAPDKRGIPPHQTGMEYRERPQRYKDIVVEFGERISQWPQYKDMPFQSITSGLLQVLLFAVNNCDKKLTKKLIKSLLNDSFIGECEDGGLPRVFSCEASVRVLEAALYVSCQKTYTQLYAECFTGRLAALSTVSMLNFTVQRLFDNVQQKEEFESMFDEMGDFDAVLSSGNTGVLVAIAKASLRLKARQTRYLTQLENALKCSDKESSEFISCCLRLPGVGSASSQQLYVHIHGSVILQTLLYFQRPTRVVSAMLSMPASDLVSIFSDCKGCHVVDAYFAAPFVGVKARDKLVWLLKGHYRELSLSQYGSRAVETIFNSITTVQKCRLMDELSEKCSLLSGTQYGRLIATKLRVDLYKTSPDKWQSALDTTGGCKAIFKDIVDYK